LIIAERPDIFPCPGGRRIQASSIAKGKNKKASKGEKIPWKPGNGTFWEFRPHKFLQKVESKAAILLNSGGRGKKSLPIKKYAYSFG
jgi:hypothetical protein